MRASTEWPRGSSAPAPGAEIRRAEESGDLTTRLALQEEAKNLPFGAAWDEYCRRAGAPVGAAWIAAVKEHEKNVLSKRK